MLVWQVPHFLSRVQLTAISSRKSRVFSSDRVLAKGSSGRFGPAEVRFRSFGSSGLGCLGVADACPVWGCPVCARMTTPPIHAEHTAHASSFRDTCIPPPRLNSKSANEQGLVRAPH